MIRRAAIGGLATPPIATGAACGVYSRRAPCTASSD